MASSSTLFAIVLLILLVQLLLICHYEHYTAVHFDNSLADWKCGSDTKTNDKIAPPRPALDALVNRGNNTIIGDVNFLLDFAIVGFAQCATTTMHSWLCQHHPEAYCPIKTEVRDLQFDELTDFVWRLYTEIPEGAWKRGFKSPNFIGDTNALQYMGKHFPSTKLIIGLRHPVLWFETYYNFRINNEWKLDPPNDLIGECKELIDLCTERALFHVELSRLGKTNMKSKDEVKMKKQYRHLYEGEYAPPPPLPNKVFLYVIEQLSDKNVTRTRQFAQDMQQFVGFEREMKRIPHFRPGKKHDDDWVQSEVDDRKIDICDAKHDKARRVLMKAAKEASTWILEHFLQSDDVMVSSREHFKGILEAWKYDPCEFVRVEVG